MDRRFTAFEIGQLASTLDVCARPFDFPSVHEWRVSLLTQVMRLLSAKSAHCDLYGMGIAPSCHAVGYPPGVFEEWAQRWREVDTAVHIRRRLRLTVYTRRHRYHAAGTAWTESYRRSAVFNEFYVPHRLAGDGGGIYVDDGDVRAHLHTDSHRDLTERMDDRARALFGCIEPVFRSSLRALAREGERHWSATQLLDAEGDATALVDPAGRFVHQTRAFERSLGRLGAIDRAHVLEVVASRAREVLRHAFAAGAARHGNVRPAQVLELHGLTASMVVLGVDGPLRHPFALVRLRDQAATSTAMAGSVFGLTRRELEVAQLLAEGNSNKDIAGRLAISWHTVRRHVESVLHKVGADSRSGVAHALKRLEGR